MKLIFTCIFGFILSVISIQANAQRIDSVIQWSKTYGKSIWGISVSRIINTPDSGSIFISSVDQTGGGVTKYHGGVADAWVVKLNKYGVIDWQRTYGGTAKDVASDIVGTSDSGYIFVGTTWSNDGDISSKNHDSSEIWVVKLKKDGSIQWQNTYGGERHDDGYAIISTLDGGYAITGSSNSNDGDVQGKNGVGTTNAVVLKIKNNGSLEWMKTYGGSDLDAANKIIQQKDSSYLVLAYTRSNDGDVKFLHGLEMPGY